MMDEGIARIVVMALVWGLIAGVAGYGAYLVRAHVHDPFWRRLLLWPKR
jgi:hypothetical protein